MKRALFYIPILFFIIGTVSCVKPSTLLVPGSRALLFTNQGGSQTVTFSTNRDWQVVSSQSWCTVSPSSGTASDYEITVTITVHPNTSYDSRNCTLSITADELNESISVSQDESQGILVSPTTFDLSNVAQTVEIEVKRNVQFKVIVDEDYSDWIRLSETKSLASEIVTFDISPNDSYDSREGMIVFKQIDGVLSETVTIHQNQVNGLIVENSLYEVSEEEQQLDIIVYSNVNFIVHIDDDCSSWISTIQTKGLTESIITLLIENNEGGERIGKVALVSDTIKKVISIRQYSLQYVDFEDPNFKSFCVNNFDINNDGEISIFEARNVNDITCSRKAIESLKGIESFTNLNRLDCSENFLTVLDVSQNLNLQYLTCPGNKISNLIVNTELFQLVCSSNYLSSLNLSDCHKLSGLNCSYNSLTHLELSGCNELDDLNCSNNYLSSLDLRNCNHLYRLYCGNNSLSSLDLHTNSALQTLSCESNSITSLDLSNNKELMGLDCSDNLIPSLVICDNSKFVGLRCTSAFLTSLTINNCPLFSQLEHSNSSLTRLSISNCKALEKLLCANNQITELEIFNCETLRSLNCQSNRLTNISINDCKALTSLYCSENQLVSLDVSSFPLLTSLWCFNNLLRSLDVSNNTSMSFLWCNNNPYLTEIWLKTGQNINTLLFDEGIATIYYKD